ncbi:MAG TPA: glycosyltransferase family 39 protein [Lentimicrobium sp.]|nr:glycosyltransferase family 39 protein [Lentimicrobium sp.]
MLKQLITNRSSDSAFRFCLVILAIPALLVNLGLFPLISDEPTRGIVTLEMLYSHDYIHPTINGELYFNKPPLFNWIQLLFVGLTGSTAEWVFRLPTIISAVGLCFMIYYVSRKILNEYAFLAAFAFIVSGRVLFWDSFMGLIDITYSLVTFSSFIWIVHFKEKKSYTTLFIGSYLLASLGYLMKGMPSIAFQGMSILAVFGYDRSFKELFSWKHIAGIFIFLIMVGGYYFIYNKEHPILPVIDRLVEESNRFQDTSSEKNWWLHLIEFPFNLMYEFAPVTILVILLFSRKVRKDIFKETLTRKILLLFAINIIIYWLSANMRSRYLFMLVPLLFIILIQAYRYSDSHQTRLYKVVQWFFLTGSFLISISILIYPFWNESRAMDNVVLISILLFISAISLTLASVKRKRFAIYSLFSALLLARIAFNMFNLPARINSYPDESYKLGEIKAAHISQGAPLYILGNTPVNHDASFYITRERKEVLTRKYSLDTANAYYITDQENLDTFASKNIQFCVHHSFLIKFEETQLFLVTRK